MTAANTNSKPKSEDQPLDPAVERVRRKMMRLMGISVVIMMVGLIAAIGAIFYKISGKGKEKELTSVSSQGVPTIPPVANNAALRDIVGEIRLPTGAELIDTQLESGQILLRIKSGSGEISLWVYDLSANRVFAKISVSP